MKRSYRYQDERYCCSSGSPFADEYKTVMRNGVEYVEVCGQIPLDQLIQADADACRISSIIKRFAAGDAAALNSRASSYIDLTSAPSNLMEAQQRLNDAKSYFSSLPADVQNAYNFDFSKFLSSVSDGSFVTQFGSSVGILKPKSSPEVPAAKEV